MFKRFWHIALIGGLAIGLAACIPEFANPVVGGNKADPEIIGSWSARGGNDPQAIPIDITAEGDGLMVVMRDPEAGDAKPEFRFSATTAEVGGVRYINLHPVGEDVPADAGSMIMRYEIKDGAIHAAGLDNGKIRQAVEAGTLKGTAAKGSDGAVKVTSSSDELAAFLATEAGQAAFDATPDAVIVLTKATP